MFAYKDRVDKYGVKHRDYFLTQGDTITLVGNPPENMLEAIRGVTFRMGTPDPNNENLIQEIHSQNYTFNEGKFYCVLSSETTKNWEITGDGDPYVYEIAVKLADNNEKTVMQAEFTIWKQIKED